MKTIDKEGNGGAILIEDIVDLVKKSEFKQLI